jgi:2-methylaconitate cis-trans-isomerase PrpF
MGGQLGLSTRIIRCGASKVVCVSAPDLPSDPMQRDATVLAIFGSNDPRQVDGLGGAAPSTSRVAIVAPSAAPDADARCVFGEVGIERLAIAWSDANADAAGGAALDAVMTGLVAVREPVTIVRIFDVTAGEVIRLEIKVAAAGPSEPPFVELVRAGTEVVVELVTALGATSTVGVRLLAEGIAYAPEKKIREFLTQLTTTEETT